MRAIILYSFLNVVCFGYSQSLNKKLIGKWIWIETSGGFGGEIINPQTEKCEVQVQFTKNGIYSEWKNKQAVHCYKYSIKVSKSIHSEELVPVIFYASKENSPVISDSFEFKGKDTLLLKNECHDCYLRVFVRKK